MFLKNWTHDVLDIHKIDEFDQQDNLSVLANAVDLLNLRLAKRVPDEKRILEIGCGVQSLFLDNLKSKEKWEGIDVFEKNDKGQKTIATKIASVEDIPFNNGYFDYVLSNQSIEHWHEYHVTETDGLSEIRRVLAPHGKAIINFPIHLHGNKNFVKGNFKIIDKCFDDAGLEITKRTAVINSSLPNYAGWKNCGFPDFYTLGLTNHEETSYVVEYEATPVDKAPLTNKINKHESTQKIKGRRSALRRNIHHGWLYLIWKILKKLGFLS